MPAFCAVTLRAPPRRNSPVATVRLPARRFTSTFSPFTSNSVTSAAAVSATALTFAVSGSAGCVSFDWGVAVSPCAFVVSCADTDICDVHAMPALNTSARLSTQLPINFRIWFTILYLLLIASATGGAACRLAPAAH
jgi:hypothetical protein